MMKNKKERIINIITVIFAVLILINYSIYLFCTVSNGGKTWNVLNDYVSGSKLICKHEII